MIYVHSSMPAMHELGEMPPEKTLGELLARYDADRNGRLAEAEAPDNNLKKLWFLFDLDGSGWLDQREFAAFQARNAARSGFYGLRPGVKGDATANIVWSYDKGLPNIPSPLLLGGALFLLREGGILSSLDPATGAVIKQARVEGALGNYFASPVAADGKLYLASQEGKLAVLKAAAAWEVLKVNDLGEECWATPAIDGGAVFVRTQAALYCFREAR
jgi:hypothetical protein